MNTHKETDNIELRSEKVRNIIGQVPPALVRIGTVIVTLVIIVLAIAFYTVRYPITIEAKGNVTGNCFVDILVPYKYLYLFDEPRTALVTLEGQDENAPGIPCSILSHDSSLVAIDGEHFFVASVSTHPLRPLVQPYMKVSARIVVSDKTLWQLVFER